MKLGTKILLFGVLFAPSSIFTMRPSVSASLPDWCDGVFIRKSCAISSENQCQLKGEKNEFMSYDIEEGVKVYEVYRIGAYKADDIVLSKGCRLKSSRQDLTPLLSGIEKRCHMSSNFKKFFHSVADLKGDDTWIAKKPWSPAKYNTFEPGKVVKHDGWSNIFLKIEGPYKGLDVVGMEIQLGHSSGYSGFIVHYLNTPDQVSKAMGNGWSQKKVTTDLGDVFEGLTYGLKYDGRQTAMYCSFNV